MKLLPGEEEILTSDNKVITVTSHRVSLRQHRAGRLYQVTIFLEDISATQITYKNNQGMLLLSIISLYPGLSPQTDRV